MLVVLSPLRSIFSFFFVTQDVLIDLLGRASRAFGACRKF